MIRLLPALADIVQINGRVTDGDIEERMGHVLQFDPESRKSDDCAMNYGRCLWTNNENIISIYKAKEAAEIQKTKDNTKEFETAITRRRGASREEKKSTQQYLIDR